VSPIFPLCFWRVETYDYYNHYDWQTKTETSTIKTLILENASKFFTVELNANTQIHSLPTPTSTSTIFNITLFPNDKFQLLYDETAQVYKIQILEPTSERHKIAYKTSTEFINFTEISNGNVMLENLPENINKTYLQLPVTLPMLVKNLAMMLKNSSLGVFDQVVKDAKYIADNFEYDYSLAANKIQRIIDSDWVLWFIQRKRGICIDAATALTVILRIQGIPARVVGGFKPSYINEDKIFYYTSDAHAWTEVYLPPFGWVPFDATPSSQANTLLRDNLSWNLDTIGPPTYFLRMLTSNTLIRNMTNEIVGVITTNVDYPINTSVRISLDNKEIAYVKTSSNGFFAHKFYIRSEETLGKHTLSLEADKYNLTLKQEVRIVARTCINLTVQEKGFFGNSFKITVHLTNDEKHPLAGQTITIENYCLSLKTDSDGKSEIAVEYAHSILPESAHLIVVFDGSDQYFGTTASAKILTQPNPRIFIMAVLGLLYVTLKENILKRIFTRILLRQKTLLPKSAAFVISQAKSSNGKNLKISCPQIEDTLPMVWGLHDDLKIKCALTCDTRSSYNYKIRLFINNACVFEKKVTDSRFFMFSHAFYQKGDQKISAVLYDDAETPLDTTEIEIRIVDYREEIIALYQTFLKNLIKNGITIKDHMTAREIERMLQQTSKDFSKISCVTKLFEESEYSHHRIDRKNYKEIYFAFNEMILDVE